MLVFFIFWCMTGRGEGGSSNQLYYVYKSNPLYVKYYFIILAICLSLDFNFLPHGFDLPFSSFLCILFSPFLWLLGLDISKPTNQK